MSRVVGVHVARGSVHVKPVSLAPTNQLHGQDPSQGKASKMCFTGIDHRDACSEQKAMENRGGEGEGCWIELTRLAGT